MLASLIASFCPAYRTTTKHPEQLDRLCHSVLVHRSLNRLEHVLIEAQDLECGPKERMPREKYRVFPGTIREAGH